MKLLITTQAVDEADPILGFFCRWLTEFSKHFERIEVISLREGKHTLPSNVFVHSLGKEKGRNRIGSIARFGYLIWHLRRNYDSVLVHMNPEYVILGGLDWKVMGKPIALWYNHPEYNLRLALASTLTNRIFYTSPFAATAHMKNAIQMPVGIDTDLFTPQKSARKPFGFYLQGRIMPSKHVDVALSALRIVREQIPATLTLVGPENKEYGRKLREDFADLVKNGAAAFFGPKPNEETPALYSSHRAALNLAASGHFDKSAFEPMACETPVIVASEAFKGIVPPEWIVTPNDPASLARAMVRMAQVGEPGYEKLGRELRENVVRDHSLTALAERLARILA